MIYLFVFLLGLLAGMFVGCLIAASWHQQQEAERVARRRRYGVAS